MSLIDREEAKRAITENFLGSDKQIFILRCILDEVKTVDTEPVKHGEWVEKEICGFTCINCSVCGREPFNDISVCGREPFNDIVLGHYYCSIYCPHCGAKNGMKDGEQDE